MANTDYTLFVAPRLTEKQIKRLYSRIEKSPETGCWNWIGTLASTGYGCITFNQIYYNSHRLVYVLEVGPIPKGNRRDIPVLDHICRNTKCCNPDHLRLVSNRENILSGIGPCAKNHQKTHCIHGHLYTGYTNIRGDRVCKICALERVREYRARLRNSHKGVST